MLAKQIIKEVEDDAYGPGWSGDTAHAPSQNAVYNKVNSVDTAVALNTTHRGSDGSDHSFIDQDVTVGSSPALNGPNISNLQNAKMFFYGMM